MLYKFRWFVAVIVGALILLLGVVADLIPRWHMLKFAQQEEARLRAKVTALPAQRLQHIPAIALKNKRYLLPAITKLAAQQNVTMNSVSETTNGHVHFSAHANYSNMMLFINLLLTSYSASLPGFTYQAIGNNEVRFVVDAILAQESTDVALTVTSPHNPFCGQAGNSSNFSVHAESDGMSLDLQNNSLSDTVRLLAKLLDRNVIVSPAVEGNVTLHLRHAKAANVFDILLDTYGLEALHRKNVWYVAPRDELIKRRQQEMKWQHLSDQTAVLLIETWQIHYGKAEEIARVLQDGKVSLLSARGRVRVDARTNIICVQDVPDRMAAIRQLIRKLDQPAQQVRIEARLASVDHDCERELGVDFAVQAKDANNIVPGRYSVAVARLPDGSLLDVKLAALENMGRAELISSPSLYTANQQPAAIEAGEEVPYQEVSESGGTAVVFKKAVLSLKVTPQVLPGGYVLLQLRINQDRPGSRMVLGMPTISTRQILTSVLVKSGQTAVLGGIYENQDENAVRRIPLLGNVPVLGELFTLRASRQTKRQLLIFVTPKIMTQPL